nr:hypothetical protein [Tanacetum cinerariifolium]
MGLAAAGPSELWSNPTGAHTVNLEKSLAIVPITSRCSANVLRISCTSSSNLAILYGMVLAATEGGGGGCWGACMGVGSAWTPSSTVGAASLASWAPTAAFCYLSSLGATHAHVSPKFTHCKWECKK